VRLRRKNQAGYVLHQADRDSKSVLSMLKPVSEHDSEISTNRNPGFRKPLILKPFAHSLWLQGLSEISMKIQFQVIRSRRR
jgi:hypothetical protein